MCCMHPQQLFWSALLYSFAFNITGSCLVEPHLVKSLQLSQAFCHHPKVFPSSSTWYFFPIPLWLLTRETCFCQLFLFKDLVRPHPLNSTRFWWLCFQHRRGKIIYPGTSAHAKLPTNSSPVQPLAQMLVIILHAGHAPSHCSDQKTGGFIFQLHEATRSLKALSWRCAGNIFFSSTSQRETQSLIWEGLKMHISVLSAPCASKASCSSCVLGDEQAQVGLEVSPNHLALPCSLENVVIKQDCSLPHWWIGVC